MIVKRTLVIFIVCFFALQVCAQQTKGTLIIIGGGSRPPEMIKRIISESGLDNGGYGIILPMSSSQPDSSVYYAKLPFISEGLSNIHGLHFKKGESIAISKLDSIRNAKLIYISGGDQVRFMEVVRGTAIEKTIREAYIKGAVIAGTSAGAAVMSKVMITGNELKNKDYASTFKTIEENNIEVTEGLGLINTAVIDQHFVRRSRYNRLISAVIEYPELTGIGIDEATAIIVKGQKVEVIGNSQVIVLKNTNKSKTVLNGKLGERDIQLNVYLPGDTFSIR